MSFVSAVGVPSFRCRRRAAGSLAPTAVMTNLPARALLPPCLTTRRKRHGQGRDLRGGTSGSIGRKWEQASTHRPPQAHVPVNVIAVRLLRLVPAAAPLATTRLNPVVQCPVA